MPPGMRHPAGSVNGGPAVIFLLYCRMNVLNVGYSSTNYFLLTGGPANILVDAGWPGTIGRFRHVLRSKGLDIDAVHYFFVTHFHPDHAGLVQEIKELGGKFLLLEEQAPAIPLMRRYIKPGTPYKEIQEAGSILLTARTSRAFLKRLGLEGELVLTPGHSDDSISLVLDSGEAFIGDLPPRMLEEENVLLSQSLKKLQSMGVRQVHPAHGPDRVVFDPFRE
jgi:ribonuclease/clavin/mitogillin